ncbi:hypothetical protein Tco_0305387 [Tanacetum coccineum]
MTTLNEPIPHRTGLGSGPRRQDTMGDRPAQTRFERLSKQSNEPHLSRVNTLGSGEDSMKLQELIDLCTKLSDKVLDLENVKGAQALEIKKLKKRVKKLEKKSLGDPEDASKQERNEIDQDEGIAWFQEDSETQGRYGYDIGVNTASIPITTVSINITTAEPVTTASAPITTAGVSVSTAEPSTPPTTKTTTPVEDEDLTITQTLMKMKKEELDQESSKRQKIGESSELAEEPRDKEADELSQEELQQMMIIVPEQRMNVEALQTKEGNRHLHVGREGVSIINRNSYIDAGSKDLGLLTTEEKVQKKNDVKARRMLLMALPNEHLMTFNQCKDAKTLFAAIQTRFGSNEATKKTHKTRLKKMYNNFSAPSTKSLDSIFNRLQKIVSQLAILDTISFDDLYNNFKIVQQEVKRTASSSSSSCYQNMAFVSSPSSTNEVNTAYGVITANTQVSPASTQVSTDSTQVSTANLSYDTVYAFLASQPNEYSYY